MATRIRVLMWAGEKQVYALPDRPSQAAFRKLREQAFTGPHPETGRWQCKVGAAYVERAFSELAQVPGFVALDEAPEDVVAFTWRDRPVSHKQVDLLEKLGVELPAGANRGAASDLIDAALSR